MDETQVTLMLPAELVRQATEEGLLTPERVAAWLTEELARTQATSRLFTSLGQLRSTTSDRTPEDLEAELDDYYAGKRASS
jgi:hypothetical protein